MSRPHTSQPEQHGVAHQGQAPQVAVRDGNRLLCPCCGQVLMVLKEKRFTPPKMHKVQGDPRRTWPALEKLIAEQEAHYQNVSSGDSAPQQTEWADFNLIRPFYRADALMGPIDPQIAAYEFPESDPPRAPQPVKRPSEGLPSVELPGASLSDKPTHSASGPYDQRQPSRSQQPLHDPFTEEGARLFAWAYYRLQRLAVQIQKEIDAKQKKIARLQTKLDGQQNQETHQQPNETPMNSHQQNPVMNTKRQHQDRPLRDNRTHAPADLGAAPGMGEVNGNGSRRHAHADEGMAPAEVCIEHQSKPSEDNGRGPP